MGRAAIEGWITLDQAKALLKSAGQDFDALKKQAATRDFKPVPLGVTASMKIDNTLRTIDSRNVIGRLDGVDPKLKDEFVVYTAHWDHFGKNADGIFHGAEDDALGCAALVEMARAFTKLPAPPRRSIVFLAVTAEEQGLLGSEYYAKTPIYPLAKTVANINMDSWNVHGRTKDLTLIGFGASDLDDYARDAAGEQGRVVHADAEPEKGLLLPLRSLQLRESRACRRSIPTAASTTSASRRIRRSRCATSGTRTAITRRRMSCCRTGI